MDISEVYLALKASILDSRNLDVTPKSVISDLFLVPTATEVTKLKILVSLVAGLQSFESIKNTIANTEFLTQVAEALDVTVDQVRIIISGTLDKLAANYNKTRKAAMASTGIANLYRPDIPDPGELATLVPLGTIVTTAAGITYSTTQAVPYSNFYYSGTLGAYVLDVPIECTTVGTIGNIPVEAIVILSTPVPNWGNVTNFTEITNGLDIESDTNFASRMELEIAGNNVGTKKGIESVLLQTFPQVSDLITVGAGDPAMTRDLGWGGKVDIYILEKSYILFAWSFNYNGEDTTFATGLRPISATSAISPSEGTLTFTRDTTSVYKDSTQSKDFFSWSVKPAGPYPKTITISYYYDKNVVDVQDFMAQDAYNTGADVLVKQSTEVPIDILCDVTTLTGYSKDTVKTDILNVLTTNIDSLRLGQDLQQSDVISWITSVTGVDKVSLPLTKFNRHSLTGNVDTITASKNEYIRLSILQIAML